MKLIAQLHQEFEKQASLENKKQSEAYFKGVISFYGLKGPQLKDIWKIWWPEVKQEASDLQIELAFELMQSDFAEDKNMATLILNKNHKNLAVEKMRDLEQMIDREVYDWATCDCLCGKVLRHLIERDRAFAKRIVIWKKASGIWRKRAAAVSFVNLARHGDFNSEIIEICTEIIRDPERFVQLGAGWVLRELSLADLVLVVDFIKKNYDYFSREGLRYALEKMDEGVRRELLDLKK